jgi:hypothetical protein
LSIHSVVVGIIRKPPTLYEMKTFIFIITLLVAVHAEAQTKASEPNVQEIIQKFGATESQNKMARAKYAFVQDLTVQTIGATGAVTGEIRRVSEITYDKDGKRIEKIISFPRPTVSGLALTPEDLQDLAGVRPFALTSEELPKYRIDYKGREHIDELDTYVFDVKPLKFVTGERYFQGKIWVDDRDLQVVRAKGQAVPEVGDQRFPHFESYRENIDGKYWFPTYVYADDVLKFRNASTHIKMIVKFSKYRKLS